MAKNRLKEDSTTPGLAKVPEVPFGEAKTGQLPTTMKVEITGSVYDGKEFLTGVVELDYKSAMSLIESEHAKSVEE